MNHFRYFTNKRSVDWLVAGLTRTDDSDGGFLPLQAAPQDEPKWRAAVRRSRSTGTPRPLAVVLPGTMGSSLQVDGDPLWLAYWPLFKGGLKRLRKGGGEVRPTGLIDDFYGPLIEFLARSHRVEIFPTTGACRCGNRPLASPMRWRAGCRTASASASRCTSWRTPWAALWCAA